MIKSFKKKINNYFNKKNIETKISNYDKLKKLNNIINNKKTINKQTTFISNNLYNDLDIYFSEDLNKNYGVLNFMFNKCQTNIGKVSLEKIIKNPTIDKNILINRQIILNMFYNININDKIKLIYYFNKIKSNENNLLWNYFEKKKEEKDYFNTIFFTNKFIKKLNSKSNLLHIFFYYKCLFIPLFTFISPAATIIISYFIIRYYGFKIKFNFFIKLFVKTSFISLNFFSKKIKLIIIFLYGFIYLQTLYISLISVYNLRKVSKSILNKCKSIYIFLNSVNEINKILKKYNILYYFNKNNKNKNINIILKHLIDKYKICDKYFKNWGKIFKIFYNIKEKDINPFNYIINYIGNIEAHFAISLIINNNTSFPNYISSDKPYINIDNVTHPISYIDNTYIKSNSINIGNKNKNNVLIISPNASGKSMFIKSLLISILLSQTISISFSKNLSFTPFRYLNSYINNPDIIGKKSLFEVEIYRFKNYLEIINNLEKNEFIFSIIDELFSSTNYHEGISTAYSICKKLSESNNSLNIITTHYYKLSLLENYNFNNYYMETNYINENIEFKYNLLKGISKKKLAINLLKKKNIDKNIIEEALKFYNDNFLYEKKNEKKDDKIINKIVEKIIEKIDKKKTKKKKKKKKKLD